MLASGLSLWCFALLYGCRHRGCAGGWTKGVSYASTGLLILAQGAYFRAYAVASESTLALIFQSGLLVFLIVRHWIIREPTATASSLRYGTLLLLAVLTLIGLFWHPDSPVAAYRGRARWQGPWSNPNTFGLLMALGSVVALGLAAGSYRKQLLPSNESRGLRVSRVLGLFGCSVLLVGLIMSFSRGAVLAAGGALISLGLMRIRESNHARSIAPAESSDESAQGGSAEKERTISQRRTFIRRWAPSIGPTLVLIVSVSLLAYLTLRDTEYPWIRRTFSVANPNDFSWRNRLAGWLGALQMMSAKPLLGHGWNQLENVYAHYYSLPRISDPHAIHSNDFLGLGATLGIPALCCLWGVILLQLTVYGTRQSPQPVTACDPRSPAVDPQSCPFRPICGAGAVVLAFGFCFNAGLFNVTTAVPFWVLLALTTVGESRRDRSLKLPPPSSLVWLSGFLVVLLATSLWWASTQDTLRRLEFKLRTAAGDLVKGVLVKHKAAGSQPVVVCLHEDTLDIEQHGTTLRQFAELGLTAVDIDYSKGDQERFKEEFVGLYRFLAVQTGMQTNGSFCVATGVTAQRLLGFLSEGHERLTSLAVGEVIAWFPDPGDLSSASLGSTFSAPSERGSGAPPTGPSNSRVMVVIGSTNSPAPDGPEQSLGFLSATNRLQTRAHTLAGGPERFRLDRSLVMRVFAELCAARAGAAQPLDVRQPYAGWYCWLPLLFFSVGMVWHGYGRLKGASPVLTVALSAGRTWYARFAYALFLATVVVTIGLTVGPRFRGSVRWGRMAVALVVPRESRNDLLWLAEQPACRNARLCDLTEHVRLSALQRRSFFRVLKEDFYRDFVLSPIIEPASTSTDNWRRPLWEHLSPRVHQEADVSTAATSVVRYLRERVTVTPEQQPFYGVQTIWQQGVADLVGFDMLCVAGLRSVGIPARLGQDHRATFYDGSEWRPAPRPLLLTWHDLER